MQGQIQRIQRGMHNQRSRGGPRAGMLEWLSTVTAATCSHGGGCGRGLLQKLEQFGYSKSQEIVSDDVKINYCNHHSLV